MANNAITAACAQKNYELLCTHLDSIGWTYTRHDKERVVTMGMRGKDLPMEFIIYVSESPLVISLYSRLPVTVPEDNHKRTETVKAVCLACNNLTFGSFDYNMKKGTIHWRATLPFLDGAITKEQVNFLISFSATLIDDYSFRFMMLNKGMMTLQQFWQAEQKQS